MLLALDEVVIVGLHHTAAFLRDVIASEQFARGELSTHFVDEHFSHWRHDASDEKAALLTAALVASRALGKSESAGSSTSKRKNRAARSVTVEHAWRISTMGTPLRLKRIGAGPEREVELVSIAGSAITARIDGEEISAALETLSDGSAMLAIGGSPLSHQRNQARECDPALRPAAMSAEYQVVEARRGAHHAGLTSPTIDAPMPGTVLKILVEEGARVQTNDPLIVLEAMKTETTLSAESPAVIKRVCVQVGQRVDHGATLIELGPVPE